MSIIVVRGPDAIISHTVTLTTVINGNRTSTICHLTRREFQEITTADVAIIAVYQGKMGVIQDEFLSHCAGYYNHFQNITGGNTRKVQEKEEFNITVNCDAMWEYVRDRD